MKHCSTALAVILFCAFVLPGVAQTVPQGKPAESGKQLPLSLSPPKRVVPDSVRIEEIFVLSPADRELYRQIYAAQNRADWAEAERLIKRLDDRILVGQVLSDRYLSPRYKGSFDELARWMRNYSDLPMADRIYKLALNRKPPKAAAPTPPDPDSLTVTPPGRIYTPEELVRIRAARDARLEIQGFLDQGLTPQAEQRFWASGRNLFDKDQFSLILGKIAASYFYQGNDAKALALGTSSGAGTGKNRYNGNWIAGLSAWRTNDYRRAATSFEKAAIAADNEPWTASSAAFWAARARLASRQPEQVNVWLDQAARFPKTFYGMLAARQLGRDINFTWEHPPLTRRDYDRVLGEKAARRSVALWQVGQLEASDWEMRYLWRRSDETLHPLLLGLAARLDLPSTQIRVAKALDRKQILSSNSALYPMPTWTPKDGFKVDRALIFAFMRQESEFSIRAVSSSGARGLMQLMPKTASYIGRDQTLQDRNGEMLYDPSFNMQLGQRYIEYLMGKDYLGTNLFFVAGAYNGGPGNLGRWLQKMNFKNDPLLFMETIPAEETRDYVEKVVANFWIYQMRMGQKAPTLDAVAAGGWPMYNSQDRDM
ncbi:lytic transglycosylase domain-containing protein [Govanella unica]|uniref:Lytic transglycosylase domain-containing protein n=1 Tax=Govanella unica TaxID=2975056 RepID=A0A9X3TWP8_9PROT|nr:lytic transglycosylase domain-containing protein [Govania unica]MDA5193385.1 lytic transglycosylase domain-containing protein [Govania unica]